MTGVKRTVFYISYLLGLSLDIDGQGTAGGLAQWINNRGIHPL